MIVTCVACLTKYNLDDSRISPKGAKVRCSRCQHIFYIVPPVETKEEIIDDFESFAKYHEELMESSQTGTEIPSPEEEGRPVPPEDGEGALLFPERGPQEKVERAADYPPQGEERTGVSAFKTKENLHKERRSPLPIPVVVAVLFLLAFGALYLWTRWGGGVKFSSYLEYPVKKISGLWHQIFETEKRGLIVRDLGAYEEKIGEIPLILIEGKVENSSRSAKKYIKVKVTLFDQNKARAAEKETVCGRTVTREDLMKYPSAFFMGDMAIVPQTEKEMNIPSGKMAPFVVIFKDLPKQVKEFQVDIVEAPSL